MVYHEEKHVHSSRTVRLYPSEEDYLKKINMDWSEYVHNKFTDDMRIKKIKQTFIELMIGFVSVVSGFALVFFVQYQTIESDRWLVSILAMFCLIVGGLRLIFTLVRKPDK